MDPGSDWRKTELNVTVKQNQIMRTLLCLMACLSMLPGSAMIGAAGETNVDETANGTVLSPAVEVPPAPPLAPGVADIARMAQAKVSDSVILAYINNSGTVYNLDANQIIYLRDIGVSEPVLSAMLDQRQKYATQPTNPAPQPESPAPAPATDYAQPQTSYAEPAPAAAPVSTVYVIPYNGAGYTYSSGCYYPFYHPYYPGYYRRYPVCYNGFAYGGVYSGGYVAGYHSPGPHYFVSNGGYRSSGGRFYGHH